LSACEPGWLFDLDPVTPDGVEGHGQHDPTRLRLVSMVAAHEGGAWAYYALVPSALDALATVLSSAR
jgi:hypothetical protein